MEESDVSRASNLLTKMQSWTEEDWILLRHHYPEDVARFAALLRDGPPRESEGPEDTALPENPAAPTQTAHLSTTQVEMMAKDVHQSALDSREHELAAEALKSRGTGYMTATEVVTFARKAAAAAARDAVLRWRDVLTRDWPALDLEAKPAAAESPAPLPELRQDSAPMLQLRRDVRWLDDHGFRGQTRVSNFSLAEMVGLEQREFEALSLKTRQKFENRAYTALRTLNGGGR